MRSNPLLFSSVFIALTAPGCIGAKDAPVNEDTSSNDPENGSFSVVGDSENSNLYMEFSADNGERAPFSSVTANAVGTDIPLGMDGSGSMLLDAPRGIDFSLTTPQTTMTLDDGRTVMLLATKTDHHGIGNIPEQADEQFRSIFSFVPTLYPTTIDGDSSLINGESLTWVAVPAPGSSFYFAGHAGMLMGQASVAAVLSAAGAPPPSGTGQGFILILDDVSVDLGSDGLDLYLSVNGEDYADDPSIVTRCADGSTPEYSATFAEWVELVTKVDPGPPEIQQLTTYAKLTLSGTLCQQTVILLNGAETSANRPISPFQERHRTSGLLLPRPEGGATCTAPNPCEGGNVGEACDPDHEDSLCLKAVCDTPPVKSAGGCTCTEMGDHSAEGSIGARCRRVSGQISGGLGNLWGRLTGRIGVEETVCESAGSNAPGTCIKEWSCTVYFEQTCELWEQEDWACLGDWHLKDEAHKAICKVKDIEAQSTGSLTPDP